MAAWYAVDLVVNTSTMQQQKEIIVNEIHRPARRHFPRRRVEIWDLDDTWQADLVDLQKYSKDNCGFSFLLTVIDIFSKFAWGVATKTKSGKDVTEAFRSILISSQRQPRLLHCDHGTEFYNLTRRNCAKNTTFDSTPRLVISRPLSLKD